MENNFIHVQLITEKSYYYAGEQVNGLALVEIKNQTNNIELTLNCAGVERITQTSSKVVKEEVFHYSEFITLYKGSLSPSKYKFPFTYTLPINLPHTSTFIRRGMQFDTEYSHKTILKLPSSDEPFSKKFELAIFEIQPKPTALQCDKNYTHKNACCGSHLVKAYSSIGTNMFEIGEEKPVYISIDKTAARFAEYEIEMKATEYCWINGDKITRNFESVKSSRKYPFSFSKSDQTKSVVIDVPLPFETDLFNYQGKISGVFFNIEVIVRIQEAAFEKGVDYHMRLIYPIIRKSEIPQLIVKQFSEYSDWQCPQELGAQISIFQIENKIKPYRISESIIGVQNNNIQLEEGISYKNPFSETRSRGGTGIQSVAGSGFGIASSGFGIAVPVKSNVHSSNLTRNPDDTMMSSFITGSDEKKKKLLGDDEDVSD